MLAKNGLPPADDLVERFYREVLNRQRLDLLGELVSPSVVFRQARPGQTDGIDGLGEVLAALFSAVPTLYVSVNGLTAHRDLVVVNAELSGTLLLWPVYQERVFTAQVVHIFDTHGGLITLIDTLAGYPNVWEEDDGDEPGPPPAGPRWVPPHPDKWRKRSTPIRPQE